MRWLDELRRARDLGDTFTAAQKAADEFDRPWAVLESTIDEPHHFTAIDATDLERWLIHFEQIGIVTPRRWTAVLTRSSTSLARGADADDEPATLGVAKPTGAADGARDDEGAGPVPGEGPGPAPCTEPPLEVIDAGRTIFTRCTYVDDGGRCELVAGHTPPHELPGAREVPSIERLESALAVAGELLEAPALDVLDDLLERTRGVVDELVDLVRRQPR